MTTRLLLTLVILASLLCVIDVRAQQSATSAPLPAESNKLSGTYSCPMHPEVKSTKPGKCPKCKMDLRFRNESSVAVNNEPAAPPLPPTMPASPRKMVIPDVEVLDQDGNVLHFYSDLIKNKTVAINFIFTNCTTICPPLAATFARVQKEIGDKDVHFISISVDPLTDTPERLKIWGAKFKAGANWTFVTGEKQEMDKLLNALGAAVSKREDHTPAVIIGNDAKGVWTRAYGLAKPTQLVGVIENVIAGNVDESSGNMEAKP